MTTICFVAGIIAFAGGCGGLANYLLLTLAPEEKRTFGGVLRFAVSGAITAFVVPLFLSLAQSALVKTIFQHWDDGGASPDILVLIGFCVVAGFASKRFMDSLSIQVLQMRQDMRRLGNKAEAADKKATVAGKNAVEALETAELADEKFDRVAEAAGTSKEPPMPAAPVEAPAASAEAARVAAALTPDERAALNAMSLFSKRTRSGVAHDAKIARNKVSEVIDMLRGRGLAQFTTSANTGGLRVAVTPLGASVLNVLAKNSDPSDQTFRYDTNRTRSPNDD